MASVVQIWPIEISEVCFRNRSGSYVATSCDECQIVRTFGPDSEAVVGGHATTRQLSCECRPTCVIYHNSGCRNVKTIKSDSIWRARGVLATKCDSADRGCINGGLEHDQGCDERKAIRSARND